MNKTSSAAARQRIKLTKYGDNQRPAREVGDYLVRLLEWAWFVTFTFDRLTSKAIALARLRDYLGDLERAARQPIGWALVVEFNPGTKSLHAHALIAGVAHLYRIAWWQEALRRFGRTQIQPFERDEGGEYYVAAHAVRGRGFLYVGGELIGKEENQRCIGDVTVVRLHQARFRPYPAPRYRQQPPTGKEARTIPVKKTTRNRVYIAGSGMRPNGTGSGTAWLNATTGNKRVVREDGLTGNKAAYRSLLGAIRGLPEGEKAEMLSHSELIVRQFNGEWAVRDFDLKQLLKIARRMIRERHLNVTLRLVSRKQNLAAKLL